MPSPIDCVITQIAIGSKTLILHCDRDFELIAEIRPLQQNFLEWV